jgi:hypothetical protein
VPDALWAAIDSAPIAAPKGAQGWRAALSLSWQLLRAQVPLVRRSIWAASALTMAMGLLVTLLLASPGAQGMVLAVFAPIVAAIGVAFVYGPEHDPALEIALATPTSPRLVLLSRLTIIYSYDLALALLASVVLSAARGGMEVWPLVELWIGPMLFLSALALLLALLFGTTPATLTTLSLWGLRLVAATHAPQSLGAPDGLELLDAFWRADLALVPLAALLLIIALVYTPRRVGQR